MSVPFYRAFEDRYRGSRETITERLRAYLDFVAPLATNDQSAVALDLGCGRGEWLELVGKHGFSARGVDLDEGMLAACRERGLAVETVDALAALRALPDESIAVVSAFHLVEHVSFEILQQVVSEALRVLQPGGLLIMETPNPENPMVGACSFYLDPSHLRPLPPLLLTFLAEHTGFVRNRAVLLQEDPVLHTDAPVRLFQVLNGVSPDYSVVAQKAAAPEFLQQFDGVFHRHYGISLAELAGRFEEVADNRQQALAQRLDEYQAASTALSQHIGAQQLALTSQQQQLGNYQTISLMLQQQQERLTETVNAITADQLRLETQLAQSQARFAELLLQFETTQVQRSAQTLAQLAEVTSKLAHLDARAMDSDAAHSQTGASVAQLQQRLEAILASRSWRLTSPLRRIGSLLRRLRR